MSRDAILAIVAISIAVAQVFVAAGLERSKTVTIGLAVAGVLAVSALAITTLWTNAAHEELVKQAKEDILKHIKGPSTFDELYSCAYYRSFDVESDAIVALISDGSLDSSRVAVKDQNGDAHTIRVFSIPR